MGTPQLLAQAIESRVGSLWSRDGAGGPLSYLLGVGARDVKKWVQNSLLT